MFLFILGFVLNVNQLNEMIQKENEKEKEAITLLCYIIFDQISLLYLTGKFGVSPE